MCLSFTKKISGKQGKLTKNQDIKIAQNIRSRGDSVFRVIRHTLPDK